MTAEAAVSAKDPVDQKLCDLSFSIRLSNAPSTKEEKYKFRSSLTEVVNHSRFSGNAEVIAFAALKNSIAPSMQATTPEYKGEYRYSNFKSESDNAPTITVYRRNDKLNLTWQDGTITWSNRTSVSVNEFLSKPLTVIFISQTPGTNSLKLVIIPETH
jgi:hypothetical protein